MDSMILSFYGLQIGVLSLTESYINKHSPDYPVGRSRLEALSVFACAFIMTMASVEVIQFSVIDIVAGVEGKLCHGFC